MNATNIIVIIVIALILGSAVYKIIKDKKKGNKCMGCPYSGKCTSCPSDYDIE